jgi:hypothetical protein
MAKYAVGETVEFRGEGASVTPGTVIARTQTRITVTLVSGETLTFWDDNTRKTSWPYGSRTRAKGGYIRKVSEKP